MEDYVDPRDFFSDWMDVSVRIEEVYNYTVVHYEYFNIFSSPFDIIQGSGECDFTVNEEPAKWWADLKGLVIERLINAKREVFAASYDSEYKNRTCIIYPCHDSKFVIDISTRVYDPDIEQREYYIDLRIEITKPDKKFKKLSSLSLAALSMNNTPSNNDIISCNLYYDGDTISCTPFVLWEYFLLEFKAKVRELSNTYIHVFDELDDIVLESYSDEENDSTI